MIQIQGAVGTDGRARAHGTHDNHRLVAFYGQVKKISRFFKRVRSVSDDDAVDVGIGQQRIDPLRHFEQHFIGDGVAFHIAQLFAADFGQPGDFGDCLQ